MISEIRGATKLFFKNFQLFSALVLTVWLPASILLVYLRLYVFPEMTGGDEWQMALQEIRISSLIELTFNPLYVGAILYAASRFQQGQKTSYGEAMAHGARKSFKLLGTRLLAGILTALGLLAFVAPGIFIALRFSLIDSIVVLEGSTGFQAGNISYQLTKGKGLDIFLTVITVGVTLIIPFLLVDSFLSLIGQSENIILQVFYECFYNIIFVIPTLVLFLFYWEARHPKAEVLEEEVDWQS